MLKHRPKIVQRNAAITQEQDDGGGFFDLLLVHAGDSQRGLDAGSVTVRKWVGWRL